ncbi:MAG: putative oxidoreductase [Kangiellaceae bacterium]|jgi:putative oxidoreductase
MFVRRAHLHLHGSFFNLQICIPTLIYHLLLRKVTITNRKVANMDKLMSMLEMPSLVLGRTLLGLYFIVPGLQKIGNYEFMSQYMAKHGVPMVDVLLPVTIVLQLLLGVALIIGFKTKPSAFLLAGMTLVISLYLHSFWNLPEGGNVQHETQNLIKNMAIMAGLLVLSARGAGQFSLDNKIQQTRTLF